MKPLRIIVCIKQVPGTTHVKVDEETGNLKRDGVESKMNMYDLFSIEAALSLTDKYGGTVRVLSMGPPQAESVLREALYMGADTGVLVSDKRFAGSDVLATAYTLSQAISCIGDYDLILCGKQTTDGDTAQVGAELAEFLEIPHTGGVSYIEPDDTGSLKVISNRDDSIITQEIPLPCLLCLDGDVNTPRLPSYLRKKSLSDDRLQSMTLNDLSDRDETHYGLQGSPTQVEAIFPPEKSNEQELYEGTAEDLGAKLTEVLMQKKIVKV